MRIYPAIDIKDGKCVRLKMGDMEQATEYGQPSEMAVKWQSMGAQFLHIVDLDAAFSGEFSNYDTVAKILTSINIPMQLGGGIRSMNDIDIRLSLGIDRVIIGTAAFENPNLVSEATAKYPGRIVAGIDAKDGKVATRGWATGTDADPIDLALEMKRRGVTTVVYTDIMRDGMLTGPNIEMTRNMVEITGMDIIASGGMSVQQDVEDLLDTGVEGVIIGKALYSGTIDLNKAIKTGAE
ncbi:MAG: 1-(5-phosphoribosyl)-5-[(5-phosphoribosylamino)methylideneamino]imidazole-4-carboxamide isomerase [Clostridia bacterium]|jgi:phosphoribosylformimino-5-aminoimidazole carboxamide ribotide isomerase|nr:1-(5-phosphoribosyl)-5-[(5-phosphoribosylamino)methylideneamino]imidazole-4-carboxamide isomerase [Clostridia bacterium]MBT7122628.1 1-(5-phosphoribosyl)-5-[(5-phosphoribosylamino)methylideneamino]imidazole-4-carboxamide isomerase [Clostridia bacterium]